VRSLRPDKALQLPSAGRGFMGQRRPTSLPSQRGSCRLIAHSIRDVSRSFDYSDRVTREPETINRAMRILRYLKNNVDEATQTTHAAELEAVHLAISPRPAGDISSTVRTVLDRLGSRQFEEALSRARQCLLTALS
jgi:hypothetical protein